MFLLWDYLEECQYEHSCVCLLVYICVCIFAGFCIIPNNSFEDFFFFFLVPETLDLVVLKVLVLKGGMFPRKHGFNEF